MNQPLSQTMTPSGFDASAYGFPELLKEIIMQAGVPDTIQEIATDFCKNILDASGQGPQLADPSVIPPELLAYWPDLHALLVNHFDTLKVLYKVLIG